MKKMEESDWVVLRLLRCLARCTFRNPTDMDKAVDYLESKYGVAFCRKCWNDLSEQSNFER